MDRHDWRDAAVIDAEIGQHMAYWAELASTPSSQRLAPNSSLQLHASRLVSETESINVSVQAWRALASASEQAGFAEHARYITGGGIVDRPQTSLARSVLLGSARTIYLLEPEDPEDQVVRAAILANQEVSDLRNTVRSWNEIGVPLKGTLDTLSAYADATAEKAAAALEGGGLKPTRSTKDTEILKTTLSFAMGDGEKDLTMLMEFWNRASGMTHARGWPWSVHPPFDPAASFLNAWVIPCRYLETAWNLWNERRGASDTPACPPPGWEPDRSRWGLVPGSRGSELRLLRDRATLFIRRRIRRRS